MHGSTPNLFEREHQRIDALLQAHLLDVVGGDFKSARRRLAHWRYDKPGVYAHVAHLREQLRLSLDSEDFRP